VVFATPGAAEALEFRAIVEADEAETLVEAVEGERGGARGRPGTQVEGGLVWRRCGEGGGGVARPRRFRGERAGVKGEVSASGVVGRGDGELEEDGRVEEERRVEG
jgi:hypothetical protein